MIQCSPLLPHGRRVGRISHLPVSLLRKLDGQRITADHFHRRAQDRIDLPLLKSTFEHLLAQPATEDGYGEAATASQHHRLADGAEIGHGDMLIAAVTSCTNTSHPGVMLPPAPDGHPAEGGVTPAEPDGTGSSRDRTAKGTRLFGVQAEVVRSFECIDTPVTWSTRTMGASCPRCCVRGSKHPPDGA